MQELPPKTTRLTEIHSDERKSRLAARLRDNLMRRKRQSRERDADDTRPVGQGSDGLSGNYGPGCGGGDCGGE